MDYEYLFRKICERRLVTLSKVESVAFNTRVDFGLPNNTVLLAAVANTFYFLSDLSVFTNSTYAGVCNFEMTPNSGQGSAGNLNIPVAGANASEVYRAFEFNSFTYLVTTHSAGIVYLSGSLFKITYTA